MHHKVNKLKPWGLRAVFKTGKSLSSGKTSHSFLKTSLSLSLLIVLLPSFFTFLLKESFFTLHICSNVLMSDI